MMSIVLYVAIGFLLGGGEASFPPATAHTLTLALGGVFVLQALFALLVLPRLMSNRASLSLVRIAVYESGAIMGLVLTLLTHNPMFTLYFGVPAFLLIALTP